MIKTASFLKSITNVSHLPDNQYPQILLLGRSNVGKSSFINAITNRKALARVSNTPGKTITLNMYEINESLYLIDAPGYGYARRSFSMQADFLTMIKNFVSASINLKEIFLLIDFKVGPTADDLQTYQSLINSHLPLSVICTKYDKVKSSHRLKQQSVLKKQFNPGQVIYFVSNETKYGIDQVISHILNKGE